jgi:hypothetical protein
MDVAVSTMVETELMPERHARELTSIRDEPEKVRQASVR